MSTGLRKAIELVLIFFVKMICIPLLVFAQDDITQAFVFDNGNTRETYESVHHVKAAHKIATGLRIKIGIIDTYFGYTDHPDFYSGGKDFINNDISFNSVSEHGYWMALTLKEIAPDAEIYALNVRSKDRSIEAQSISVAIDWAIEQKIDVLTYSGPVFLDKDKKIIDLAVKKATDNGISIAFLHYSNQNNILPFGLLEYDNYYAREPDIRVLHYDYNLLLLSVYEKYLSSERKPANGNEEPYFSFSSMAVVVGGTIALMKEINNSLPSQEYKNILRASSQTYRFRNSQYSYVLDIFAALKVINTDH